MYISGLAFFARSFFSLCLNQISLILCNWRMFLCSFYLCCFCLLQGSLGQAAHHHLSDSMPNISTRENNVPGYNSWPKCLLKSSLGWTLYWTWVSSVCVFVGPACGGCVCVLCGWNLDTFVLGGCFIYKAGRKPFSVTLWLFGVSLATLYTH